MFLWLIRLTAWWPPVYAAHRAVTLSLFILITLWWAVIYQVEREDQEALHQAEINITNLNRAFAEHSAKTIQGADQAARFVRAEYLDKGPRLDLLGYLRDKEIVDADYQLLSVIDAQGFVAHSSQPFQHVDLRDREHFKVHADSSDDRLFISKPVLGRVSGKWSIQVTRRVTQPHTGAFGGVVVVSLSPDYFTRFYQGVDLGKNGVIAMLGYDGVIRARATHDDHGGGQDIASSALFKDAVMMSPFSGVLQGVSPIDGVTRLWSFQRLDTYQLVVLTGMSVVDIRAESGARARVYHAVASLVSVVVVAFLVGLVRSTRHQQAMWEQLRQSQQQAHAASEMKTRLLANVSHELRTPLNGILGYAELIRDGTSAAETQEFSQIIFDSAQHLGRLVNGLLDLARIESDRMVLCMEDVDVLALVRHIHSAHTLQAAAQGVVLRLDLPPDGAGMSWQVRTDRTRVLQILSNVLNNALKFTHTGMITLSMRRQDQRCVVLRVQDSGIGMSQQRLSQVFTRFHAMSSDPHEPTHPHQGAGLGLPLAKELAGLLHSTLTLESELGRGTVVTLYLADMRSATVGVDPTFTTTSTGSA